MRQPGRIKGVGIEELFKDHPDRDLFGSLPGAGPELAPRLLSELGCDRKVFGSTESLQCFAAQRR